MNFISFEGIEGCGKSTQSKKLHEYFLSQQIDTILTREPGGSEAGERIREILIDKNLEDLEGKSEILLNFAARLEHVEKLIKPAILAGKKVISDRFFDSTYAYQGSAFGIDDGVIDQVRKMTIADFEPEITFFIDIDVKKAFSRITNRADNNRYEEFGLDFHQKVRDGFLKLSEKNPRIKIIDGDRNIEDVFADIVRYFK